MKLRAASAIIAVVIGGVVGLTWPDQAQAGFGRRGSSQSSPSSSSSSRSSSSGSSHSSSSSVSSGGFGRSSSYRESGRSRGSRDSGYGSGWSPGYRRAYPRSWGYPVWGYGFGYVPTYPVAPMVIDGQVQPAPYGDYDEERTVAAAIAGDFTVGSTGPLLGAQLSIEGERLGVLFGYTAAFAPIAGTQQFDTLHLMLGHFTYAFIASERVRVRAELGIHIAGAPLVTFVAPGVGLSAAFGLAGPLGLEARVFGNAWPYTQLDARAGLTLTLGSVGLGAGVRALYLSDNGALGEVNEQDTSDKFIGPYVTLAVAL